MKALVLFSGGSDSTLAAALAAETAREVHLFTGDRKGYYQAEEASRPAAARLAAVYGEGRFRREVSWIEPIHARLNGEIRRSLRKEHGLATGALSFAKIALHLAAIRYAKGHGIRAVSDGSTAYMFLYPDQNRRIGLKLYRELYARHGLELKHPIRGLGGGVEEMLFQRRVNPERMHRGTKADTQVFYGEQFFFSLFQRYGVARLGYREHSRRVKRVYEAAIRAGEEAFL